MSWRIGRQLPFLRSVLREADQNVRRERLQHANADQINAISELVTNTLRGGVKVSPLTRDRANRGRGVFRVQASVGMSYGPFRRKYLVGPDDMEQLVEEYKGRLTENSRLTKAARLAAKQHALLTSALPLATKKTRVKSLTGDLHGATKRIQQMQTGPVIPGAGEEEEEPDLAQGPLDTLKSLIKSSTPKRVKHPSTGTQATPLARPPPTKQQIATTVPLPDDEDWDQPSTSTGKGKGKSSWVKTLAAEAKAKFRQKAKEAVKRKLQRGVKELKPPPGWDPWGTEVKRKLEDDF